MLLASGTIGTLYLIYLITYFTNGVVSTDGAEAIGAGLAAALVMPHMVCVAIAVIFNWLVTGWDGRSKFAGAHWLRVLCMRFLWCACSYMQFLYCLK